MWLLERSTVTCGWGVPSLCAVRNMCGVRNGCISVHKLHLLEFYSWNTVGIWRTDWNMNDWNWLQREAVGRLKYGTSKGNQMQVKCCVRGQNVLQEYGSPVRTTSDLWTRCKAGVQNSLTGRIFVGYFLILYKLTDVINSLKTKRICFI
jgi:hypothetical protein